MLGPRAVHNITLITYNGRSTEKRSGRMTESYPRYPVETLPQNEIIVPKPAEETLPIQSDLRPASDDPFGSAFAEA